MGKLWEKGTNGSEIWTVKYLYLGTENYKSPIVEDWLNWLAWLHRRTKSMEKIETPKLSSFICSFHPSSSTLSNLMDDS